MAFSYATGSHAGTSGVKAAVLAAWGTFAGTTLANDWALTPAIPASAAQRVITLTAPSGDPIHFALMYEAGSWVHCLPVRCATANLPGGGDTAIVASGVIQVGTNGADPDGAWRSAADGGVATMIPAGEPDEPLAEISSKPRGIGFPLDDTLPTEWWLSGEDDETVGAYLCLVVKQTSGSQNYYQSLWCGRLAPIAGAGGWAMLATQDSRDYDDAQAVVTSDASGAALGGCTDPRDQARGTSIFGHPGSSDNSGSFTGWVMNHAETQWAPVNPITYSSSATVAATTIGVSQLYTTGGATGVSLDICKRLVGSWEYPIRTSEYGMVAPLVSPLFFLPDSAAGVMRPFAYMPPGIYHCDKRGMPAETEIAFGAETYVLLPSKRADVALTHRHMDCAIALRKT